MQTQDEDRADIDSVHVKELHISRAKRGERDPIFPVHLHRITELWLLFFPRASKYYHHSLQDVLLALVNRLT